MIKPDCYSCRKKFEPSALRVSYSKSYCESCGVGLFGEDYFRFPEKPDPTFRKSLVCSGTFLVMLLGIAGVWFWWN
jgi:hypothetical protein